QHPEALFPQGAGGIQRTLAALADQQAGFAFIQLAARVRQQSILLDVAGATRVDDGELVIGAHVDQRGALAQTFQGLGRADAFNIVLAHGVIIAPNAHRGSRRSDRKPIPAPVGAAMAAIRLCVYKPKPRSGITSTKSPSDSRCSPSLTRNSAFAAAAAHRRLDGVAGSGAIHSVPCPSTDKWPRWNSRF